MLNFPNPQEVPLIKVPLSEVICQVKFSPILNIAKELPTDFQEAVRIRFPGFEVEQGVMFRIPASGAIEKPVVDTTPRAYQFNSADKSANLTLSTDFFAVSTKSYSHWQDFLSDFSLAEAPLFRIYHPAYATRIGLRFVNHFTRKNTGLKSTHEILDIFRNELTCVLHTDAWEEPKEMLSQMLLNDGGANMAMRIGYGKNQNEPYFLLDFDYFEEGQLPFQGKGFLSEKLNYYHSRIYSAFRWCLKETSLELFLHQKGE